jgi:pyrroline-5-carboxylate reductase
LENSVIKPAIAPSIKPLSKAAAMPSEFTENAPRLTFIGAGNMVSSIIGGLITKGYPVSKIIASAPTRKNLDPLEARYQIRTSNNNHQAAHEAEVLILGVKPQLLKAVCEDLARELTHHPLIITIAAGIETEQIDQWLGGGFAIIRCMPNTPALVLQGASGLFATERVSAAQRQLAQDIFSSVGIVEWVDMEDNMHVVTALSGSGPAYFFLIMEALEEAAVKAGIPAPSARKLAIQTILGAAEMARQSDLEPAQLKRNVMSPGGTTERAIKTFEDRGLKDIFNQAIEAATARSRELSEILGGGRTHR